MQCRYDFIHILVSVTKDLDILKVGLGYAANISVDFILRDIVKKFQEILKSVTKY